MKITRTAEKINLNQVMDLPVDVHKDTLCFFFEIGGKEHYDTCPNRTVSIEKRLREKSGQIYFFLFFRWERKPPPGGSHPHPISHAIPLQVKEKPPGTFRCMGACCSLWPLCAGRLLLLGALALGRGGGGGGLVPRPGVAVRTAPDLALSAPFVSLAHKDRPSWLILSGRHGFFRRVLAGNQFLLICCREYSIVTAMQPFKSLSRYLLIFLGLGPGLMLAGCAGSIDRAALASQLAVSRPHPTLLDVRTSTEYEAGHLPGAVNLPLQSLPFNLARVPVSDRRQALVVYCSHGPRAGMAGFFLRLGGFSEVRQLQGSFRGWSQAGLPVVTGNNPGNWAE